MRQPDVSSQRPLQSSSTRLHVSAGGLHPESVHVSLHVCVPPLPHAVVHDFHPVPFTHPDVSSTRPLQLSSLPLQISAGAAPHAPQFFGSCARSVSHPFDGS